MSAASARAMQTDDNRQARSSVAAAWAAVIVTVCITVIAALLMLGSRLTAVEAEAAQSRERAQRLEAEMSVVRGYLQSIDQRTARMEGKMENGRR